MNIIQVDGANIDSAHICCAIVHDRGNILQNGAWKIMQQ